MVSYINLFLKTEITCLPKILTKYFGDYYNNALCNGVTWIFVLWCVVHGLFEMLLEALLKKLRYREYVRSRLKSSLWYLGFYGTGLLYCGATLSQNEVELFHFKRMHIPSSSNLPTRVILGYSLICTFYLHSAFWEGLTKNSLLNMVKYSALFLFLLSSYILRIIEISFTFTALISVGQVAIEATRCLFIASTQESFLSKFVAVALYLVAFATYISVYLIVVPLTFLVPLGLKIMSDYPNMLLMFLFINLLLWMGTELYQSILLKFINHWLYHKEGKGKDNNSIESFFNFSPIPKCDMTLLECSLFKPRDDIAYNIRQLRKEIQERKSRMMAMRKPKNMFYQTLKCMVAVKRKLTEKRLFELSKSESADKSHDSPFIKTEENTSDDDPDEQEELSNEETSEMDKNFSERPHESSDIETTLEDVQRNSSESHMTDSESDIDNLDSLLNIEEEELEDTSQTDSSLNENIILDKK